MDRFEFLEELDVSKTVARDLFLSINNVWEVLPQIGKFILNFEFDLSKEYKNVGNHVWVGKNVEISPSALVMGPAIIGENSVIRHNAFIRGNVIIGENVVIGNSCEVKNSILFDYAQVPHFNYVGDSVLGYKAHMGAGSILSNVRSDKSNVSVKFGDSVVCTNLRKFGAIIGDFCEIGCNAVLNPGTILSKNVIVYPTSMVRGFVPRDFIFKNDGTLVKKIKKN